MTDDLVELAEEAREEYRSRGSIGTSDDPEERLAVVIANHGFRGDDEWRPVSIHETEGEAGSVAGALREKGHGAAYRMLPLFREHLQEHTGATQIGETTDQTNTETDRSDHET